MQVQAQTTNQLLALRLISFDFNNICVRNQTFGSRSLMFHRFAVPTHDLPCYVNGLSASAIH